MKYEFRFLNSITVLAIFFILFMRLYDNSSLSWFVEFSLLFLFIILLYRLSKIKKSLLLKNELQEVLKEKTDELECLVSSFDKNVIFSKTDLKGEITHASKAFCDISGYTLNELVGKPHSIVRHPDMPKEAFKDLWETIQLGLTWYGEVKNKKKNGESYWGFSKIMPDYDSHNNHIGYYAIRQNITAQKEVEKLKNDLEEMNAHLEQQVNERVEEIIALNNEIQDTQKEVVFTMGAIGECRSKETSNHVRRVAEYSKLLAIHYGIDEYEAELLKQASPMHDIGKIGIPDAVLNKPGIFNEEERKIMNTHSQLGYDMLKHSERPLLKIAATIAYEHHEKWDGTGYPNGLKGEEIHIYGRITAIADVFDALTTERTFRAKYSSFDALILMKTKLSKQFDPEKIDLLIRLLHRQ